MTLVCMVQCAWFLIKILPGHIYKQYIIPVKYILIYVLAFKIYNNKPVYNSMPFSFKSSLALSIESAPVLFFIGANSLFLSTSNGKHVYHIKYKSFKFISIRFFWIYKVSFFIHIRNFLFYNMQWKFIVTYFLKFLFTEKII